MKQTRHTPEQVISKLREADAMLQVWASLPDVTPSERPSAPGVSPRKMRRTTSVLRRLDQRPFSWRSPSSAPLALRARFAAEGVLCRGFYIVSRIVPLSPRWVSQETVQRTTAHQETLIPRKDGSALRASGLRTNRWLNDDVIIKPTTLFLRNCGALRAWPAVIARTRTASARVRVFATTDLLQQYHRPGNRKLCHGTVRRLGRRTPHFILSMKTAVGQDHEHSADLSDLLIPAGVGKPSELHPTQTVHFLHHEEVRRFSCRIAADGHGTFRMRNHDSKLGQLDGIRSRLIQDMRVDPIIRGGTRYRGNQRDRHTAESDESTKLQSQNLCISLIGVDAVDDHVGDPRAESKVCVVTAPSNELEAVGDDEAVGPD
jgi:hypothetical protein